MTALRHISVGLVALLLLLLGAVWLVPPWLDWNRYRDDVAALASDVLGHPVRIEGGITLRLLPQPLLVAERVSVGTGTGAGITADQLLLRVALSPLLAGRVDARDLVLRGADIRLPWPLDPEALVLRAPSWLSSLSARIERGRLQLGEVAVTGLEATLATNNISGSFLSAGRARSGGRDWMFTARISRPGGDGAVGVDITLDGQGPAQGLGGVVSGQMQADGTLLGRISVRGPDLSQLLPAPPVPFRAEGRLTSGGGLVAADEMTGEFAGAPVHGAVALRLSPRVRLDVALTASRVDLDAWLPALRKGAEGGAFARLPVGIDLSAEAAPLAGGTLREVRGAFDIEAGTVQVREARAVLPGDAQVRLEGRATTDGARGRIRFEGEAWLTAPSLRTTLAWAVQAGLGPVDSLPPGVLRRAELAGRVALDGSEINLSGLTGQVDGTPLAASLSWRPAPRPALQALVALERLDLGPWLPDAWPKLPAAARAFGTLSLDLQLEAAQASWRGHAMAPLALELTAEPGRVVLRRLELQGLGAAFAASGTLTEGGRLTDARLDLRADHGAGLAPVVAGLLGQDTATRMAPLLARAVALQIQGGGAPDALGLALAGSLGDLRLEATPTFDLAAGRWAGALTLRHPGAPRLAEALGIAGAPAWLGDGSFGLVAQITYGPSRIVAEPFDLAAGGLRARGALTLARGAMPRLTGTIAAESLPLPLPYPRSPDPLPLEALAGWEASIELTAGEVLLAQERALTDARATIGLTQGVLRIDPLSARLAGGAATGALVFDAAARPPTLALRAGMTGALVSAPVFDAPLDIAGGSLDGTLRLAAAGFSPAGLLASLGGSFTLAGREGVLAGIDVARMLPDLEEEALRAALSGGATAFERLAMDGTIDRGGLTLTRAALSGPAGAVTATGTIDLTRALLALRLAVVPAVPEAPEIGLRVTGPADAVVRVPELAGAVRWRSERK
jgi:uncharacterized protein involved in outer membrane biogenesis